MTLPYRLKPKTTFVLTTTVAALLFSSFGTGRIRAANATWNGGGADNNWATAGNWGGTAPIANDSLTFGGTTRLTPSNNIAANTAFTGLTFASGAGAFTLSGNAINLAGDITNSSASNQLITLNVALTGTRTVDVASTGALQIGNATNTGIISGSGFGIVKNGTGTLQLDSRNTFTGDITVNGGILIASRNNSGATTALGTINIPTRTIAVNSGATLRMTANNMLGTTANVPAANIPLFLLDGGTMTTTANNHLGALTLKNGALLTNTLTGAGSGNWRGWQMQGTVTVDGTSASTIDGGSSNIGVNLGANTNFIVNDVTGSTATDLTVSAIMSNQSNDFSSNGAAGFTKSGAGTMLLTALSNYTGATTVTNGTLALSSTATNNNIGSSSGITVSGTGALNVTGVTTAGGYIVAGSQSLTNNATVVGTVTANGATATLGGTGTFNNDVFVSTGTGGKIAPGASASTVGTMTILGGLSVSTGGTYAVDFNGANADRINVTGAASFLSNSQLAVNQILAPSGNYIILTATGGLSGITAGTLTTIGRTRYDIDETALALNTIQINIVGAPATLRWTGGADLLTTWNNTQTDLNWINGLAADNYLDGDIVQFNDTDNGGTAYAVDLTTTVTPGSVTVSANGNYTFNVTAGGGISGIAGLTKSGTGTLALNGTHAYTGATIVNNGTLALGGSLGNTAVTLNSGTLNIGTSSAIGTGALTLNGGTLNNTNGTALTLSTNNTQTWGGDFAFTGTNDLNLGTGAVSMTGNRTVTVNAGILTVGGAITGTATNLTKEGSGNLTLANALNTGAGSVTVNAGTLTLNVVNSYTGGTTVNSGATLELKAGGNTGAIRGLLTIDGGTVLSRLADTLGFGANRVQTVNINGGTLDHTANTNLSVWGMTVNMTGGTLQASDPGSSAAIDFGTDANASNIPTVINTLASANTATIGGTRVRLRQVNTTFDVADGAAAVDLQVSAPMSAAGAANGALTKAGNGTMLLSANNTYTTTTISGGTLHVGSGGTTGTLGSGLVTNNSILVFNRSNTLTVGGAISGTGELRQIGTGTTTLTAANSYSGATTVSDGTLLVNNASGSGTGTGAVAVSAAGTLGGVGTIQPGSANGVAVAGSAFVAPGDPSVNSGMGTLSLDGGSTTGTLLSLAAGARFVFQLNTSASDRIAILNAAAGAVSFNNNTIGLTDLSGGILDGNTPIILFDGTDNSQYAGLSLDIGGADPTKIIAGLTIEQAFFDQYSAATLNVVDGNILLTVPEPTTGIILLGGLGVLCGWRRRRG